VTVVFCCVAATKIAVPGRTEIRNVLLMILTTCVACPAFAGMLALMAHLPPDLALAASLAAASPVAIGAGALSHHFGLPERPAVWAALGGLAIGPALLPAIAALIISSVGGAGTIAVHSLAERAALFGALPAAAAFLFRRARPREAAEFGPDLRGIAVIGLCVLGLCAGGSIARTTRITDPDECIAVLVITAAVLAATAVTWATERFAPTGKDPTIGRELLVVSVARNISFVWASAMGALTPRGQAVLAVAVAATFIMPAAVYTASRVAAAARTRMADRRIPMRWLALGALAACCVLALLTLPGSSTSLSNLPSPVHIIDQQVTAGSLPVIIAGHDASHHDAFAAYAGLRCGHFVLGVLGPSPQTFRGFFLRRFMPLLRWAGADTVCSKETGTDQPAGYQRHQGFDRQSG
jgi:hypothetical protein